MKQDPRREHAERIKELDCLRGIAELFGHRSRRLSGTLEAAARLVVQGWQFPRRACVRIRLMGEDIRTPGHVQCVSRMRRTIQAGGRAAGFVEVAYPAFRVRGDLFLRSEARLLHAIAVLLGTMAELSRARDDLARKAAELRAGKAALQRKNVALGEVLAHLEDEKRGTARMLRNTVEGVLLPAIGRLGRADLDRTMRAHTVELVLGHLRSLAASGPDAGVDHLAQRLSPREIEVADLVRAGLSSKEIGDLLGISETTVERHRHNIRRKLGVKRGTASLPTYLSTL